MLQIMWCTFAHIQGSSKEQHLVDSTPRAVTQVCSDKTYPWH